MKSKVQDLCKNEEWTKNNAEVQTEQKKDDLEDFSRDYKTRP